MSFPNLFYIFLWKNYLLLKFNWKTVILVFGGCIAVFFLYLQSTFSLNMSQAFAQDGKNFETLHFNFPLNSADKVYYAPATSSIDDFMDSVRLTLQASIETLQSFSNDTQLRYEINHNCKGNCFGIVFENFPEAQASPGVTLKYSISASALRVPPKKRYINDEDVIAIKDDDEYVQTGFFLLQHVIDTEFLKTRFSIETSSYGLEVTVLPTTSFVIKDGQSIIKLGFLISILFHVVLLCTYLVPLVEEKQDGLKEFLIISTPLNFLNGVTFFLIRLLLYTIFLVTVLTAANYYDAFAIISFSYPFLFFALYMLSAMSYAYLISVCFHSVFYAKVGGFLLFIIPYVFYLSPSFMSDVTTYCLSTKTFFDGLSVLQSFSNKHRTFGFSDHFINITEQTHKMSEIYLILILQSLAYSLLYNYLSCVFPGPGGIKKEYLFFLRSSFYKKKTNRNEFTTADRGTDAIIVQDLVKRFRTKKGEIVIADHLNMAIKSKEITVLLGHNGAGKTTTLNMIMGSEAKDSGKITVCSERDVSSYRHLIGFCPQHSVFMYYMTCLEHLEFFASLRDMPRSEALNLAHNLLEQLRLGSKANEYGCNLSGGMKRRLSLGIALSGDTKIVVLDEPSSGLDIESRRELWDILLELRKRKAILVTTHHMEEAEMLGDTICILANGRLQKTGSPLDLKRKVGSGYILKICIDDTHFHEANTLHLIRQHVPSANVVKYVHPSLLISLPYEHKPHYSEMLSSLESNLQLLGIVSISVTDTSLEDVFLKCASELDEVDGGQKLQREHQINIPYERVQGTQVINWRRRCAAIFYKKFQFMRSEWAYAAAMLTIPFLSVAVAIALMVSSSRTNLEGQLTLNLAHINTGKLFIYERSEQNSRFTNFLIEEIEKHHITVEKIYSQAHTNITEDMLQLQKKDFAYFLQNVIGAIDLVSSDDQNGLQIIFYYSGNIYHSSVILLNLIDNVILKVGTNNKANNIETTYASIASFSSEVSPVRLEYYAVIVPIGLFFYMFFYLSLPFREYNSGFKLLQAMPRSTFWLSTLAFDLLLHLVICIALGLVQSGLMPSSLYSIPEQITIIISIFCYGISYLPILYGFANVAHSISTITTYLLFMLIVSAIVVLITSSSIQAMSNHEAKIICLSLLPDFNLNHQLRVINENSNLDRQLRAISDHAGMNKARSQLIDYPSSHFFVYAFVIFLTSMLFLIHILENKRKRQSLSNLFNCYSCHSGFTEDCPVVEEMQLVEDENKHVAAVLRQDKSVRSDYPLIVCQLFKFFNRKAAVSGLNFAVKKRECFGLLGVNGAGKTSTFQMITNSIPMTGGTITINGVDVLENENRYQQQFGYCPQTDCLNDFMTANQTLRFLSILRGVPTHDVDAEVEYWLEQLDLERYRNMKIRYYSGGTKRKLNTAIAMIASPSLVLLDEPTTGVDPTSRRFLWTTMRQYLERDKTIVLSSHSMDECEQLCNRLAIMANGKFRCIGSVPHLKRLYGSGFTIKFKLRESHCDPRDLQELTDELQRHLLNHKSEMREHHAGMLTYFVTSETVVWSAVFNGMEAFMQSWNASINNAYIMDYSVNESTLEDIFLKCGSGKCGKLESEN